MFSVSAYEECDVVIRPGSDEGFVYAWLIVLYEAYGAACDSSCGVEGVLAAADIPFMDDAECFVVRVVCGCGFFVEELAECVSLDVVCRSECLVCFVCFVIECVCVYVILDAVGEWGCVGDAHGERVVVGLKCFVLSALCFE